MEPFTTKGHWWLPGTDPKDALVGVLTFDPQGDTELNLFGSFSLKPRGIPTVLGKSDNGRVITLVNCLVEITDHLGDDYNWEYSRYRFAFVLMNHHFEREQDIVFELIRVKYAGLENWASTKYYLSKNYVNYEEEITIEEYFRSRPDTHSIVHSVTVVLDNFSVSVRCKHTRIDDELSSFPFEQDTDIQFVPDRPWGIEETLSRIFQMKIFLSLVMGTSTWPVSVEAFNSAATSKSITVHYNPRTSFVNQYLMREDYMYFTLEKQRKNVEECLRIWFANYKKLELVLDLYNRCISNILVAEDNFLIYAKAVEVFHRIKHDQPFIDKAKYNEIRKAIVSSLPEYFPDTQKEKRHRLVQRMDSSLEYANGLSLRGRLKDIRNKYQQNSDLLFRDFRSLADIIVDTRNYLTHYDETGSPKANEGLYALGYMSMRLRYILELCLLTELGFDESDLQAMVSNNTHKRLSQRRPDRPFPKPRT